MREPKCEEKQEAQEGEKETNQGSTTLSDSEGSKSEGRTKNQ